MSNKAYDIIKALSLIVIPFSVMIAAIVNIFIKGGDPASIILAVGEAIHGFLGAALTVSSKNYWKEQEEAENG